MKEKLKKKVKAWKKVFTFGHVGLNENSAWKDILLELKMSFAKTSDLVAKAVTECGGFTADEKLTLYALPHYVDVVNILKNFFVEDLRNVASTDFGDGYQVFFLRYPKVEEKQNNVVVLVEAVIVSAHPVPLDIDVYTFMPNMTGTKNLVVRYDSQIPREWIEQKQKHDLLFRKNYHRDRFDDIPF